MTPFEFFRDKDFPAENKRVFAIVAEAQRNIYQDYIKPACEAQELKCSSRFDMETPAGDPSRIWAELQRAQMIVADITGLNTDVLCELGIAIAIREHRYIALLCRDTQNGEDKPWIPIHLEKLHLIRYTDDSLERMLVKLVDLFLKAQLIDRRSGQVIQDLEARSLMNTACQLTEECDWIGAGVLFRAADQKEPENWYIFMHWGIMFRDQSEYALAEQKLDLALGYCELDQERARVYCEKALLVYSKDRDPRTAEGWFRRALAADDRNKQVYLSWAKFYEELGDYHKALGRANHILGQIDNEDEEAKRRFAYYSAKLSESPFIGSYKDYLNHLKQRARKPRQKAPTTGTTGDSVPWDADWKTLQRYSGSLVCAKVKNAHPHYGTESEEPDADDLAETFGARSYEASFTFETLVTFRPTKNSTSKQRGGRRS